MARIALVGDKLDQAHAGAFEQQSLAPTRHALVIGINRYPKLPKAAQLRKAINDAKDMKSALKGLGFNVQLRTNLKYLKMVETIAEFASRIKENDIVFFFFAGHGVAIDSQNFLLPSDVPYPREGEVWQVISRSSQAWKVIESLGERAQLVVAVLDACRNNPFKRSGVRSLNLSRGLLEMGAPPSTFIMHSARAGQEALDRLKKDDRNRNSVFTRVFLKHLKQPDLSLPDLAYTVRDEVAELASKVRHDQCPTHWDEFRQSRKTYLAGKTQGPSPREVARPPRPPKPLAPGIASGRLKIVASSGRLGNEHYPWFLPGAGEWFQDFELAPKMVLIPAGNMMCGARPGERQHGAHSDEEPEHMVRISRPFALGLAPVTFMQWRVYAKANGLKEPVGVDDSPVVEVSWIDATNYADWLAKKTGKKYRLPTESEWEHAARAGNQERPLYSWGDDITPEHAHYGRARDSGAVQVGQLHPNAWGLHDLHGNVWEWVADSWASYEEYQSERAKGCVVRVDEAYDDRGILRGGSWENPPEDLRCARRVWCHKTDANRCIGFRVARDI